ncbi:hypothetical protein [Bosea sp. R86505]|uniref:hypothetical protein n=1 Tax=Bosea sp. R86505 TaxID=3101710 RepID=UPI0036735FA6
MRTPDIKDARPLREYVLGPAHVAVLLIDIVSGDDMEYAHLLAVYRDGTTGPIAVVSAERAEQSAEFLAELGLEPGDVAPADGSHFLCVFHDDQHLNFGADDKWADVAEFELEALAVLSRLGVLETTQ